LESLKATIYKSRPDLLDSPGDGTPIPDNPPNIDSLLTVKNTMDDISLTELQSKEVYETI
jgi:hypothetical protein